MSTLVCLLGDIHYLGLHDNGYKKICKAYEKLLGACPAGVFKMQRSNVLDKVGTLEKIK